MTGEIAKSTKKSDKHLQHGWRIFLPAMLALSFIYLPDATAQQFPKIGAKKYNNNNEFVPEHLSKPPDLPFLPPYSGAAPPAYDSILAFRRKPDGPGYSLTFHVKETPEEVISFYKGAFKNNRWLPQKNADSSKIVSGMRKGAVATVTVMNPIMKGYKTQVYIVYKISGTPQ